MSQSHYVYVLRCADDSYYTGYTTDLERRVAEHDAGEGAKYTRGRGPVELLYHETYPSKSAAMQREYAIKQLRRAEKRRLVETGSDSAEATETTETNTVETTEATAKSETAAAESTETTATETTETTE